MYDEIEYWNKRLHPNYKPSGDTPSLEELNYFSYIKKHLYGCSNVLDFGPGVGRVFSLYSFLTRLECFDITNKHLSTLKDAASHYGFELIFTLGREVGVTPYKDKKFDVAIACQVLLHQRPVNINKVMAELIRVSDKVVVISGRKIKFRRTKFRRTKSKPTADSYCFNHNYIEICRRNGWYMSDINHDSRHIYFVYREFEL